MDKEDMINYIICRFTLNWQLTQKKAIYPKYNRTIHNNLGLGTLKKKKKKL